MADPKTAAELRDHVAAALDALAEHASKNTAAALEAAPGLAHLADAYARLDDVARRSPPKGKP